MKVTASSLSVTGCDMGVMADTGANLKLRQSRLDSSGSWGVQVYVDPVAGQGVDLGSPLDPGNNLFTAPATTQSIGLGVQTGIAVKASGNTWLPDVQGADSQGHYPSGTTVYGPMIVVPGSNFAVGDPAGSIQL
jgi:hypothetical protein